MARANSPAKARVISKLALAIIITVPIPRLDATVSDRTVPTKASVTAILREAKKYGIALGRPTFHSTCLRLAPSAFSTSSISGSVVASPVATLTMIGKMHVTIAVKIAGTAPEPNQSTRIGTTATFGIEENPTSNG